MSESSAQRETDSAPAMSAERDHSWVAMELHDGLMQWVFSARMQLERMEKDMEHSDESQRLEQVQSIRKVVSSALKEGRGLISFLEGTNIAVASAPAAAPTTPDRITRSSRRLITLDLR